MLWCTVHWERLNRQKIQKWEVLECQLSQSFTLSLTHSLILSLSQSLTHSLSQSLGRCGVHCYRSIQGTTHHYQCEHWLGLLSASWSLSRSPRHLARNQDDMLPVQYTSSYKVNWSANKTKKLVREGVCEWNSVDHENSLWARKIRLKFGSKRLRSVIRLLGDSEL